MLTAAIKAAGKGQPARPRYEVADIFRAHGSLYRHNFSLPLSHLKVMHAIEACRTSELGGHLERCDSCGYERNAYNSCRNRHCPKCQALAKAEWLEKRKAELLPVEYFHNVFTIPQYCSRQLPRPYRNLPAIQNMAWEAKSGLPQFCTHGTRNYSVTPICIA